MEKARGQSIEPWGTAVFRGQRNVERWRAASKAEEEPREGMECHVGKEEELIS